MSEILERTTYQFENKDFPTLGHVRGYIDDELGRIVDSCQALLSPKERLAVHAMLIANQERLVKLLSATYYQELPDDGIQGGQDKSIFTLPPRR